MYYNYPKTSDPSGRSMTPTLPFGLRSAPKISSADVDTIQWILFNKGLYKILHYLDNFILVTSYQALAEAQKQTLASVWVRPGTPKEVSKVGVPSQSLKFLGIKVNMVSFQLSLLDNKLQCLKT